MAMLLLPSQLLWAGAAYDAAVDSADRCMRDGDWQGAETYLLKALKAEPANPSNYLLLSNLGTVRRNMNKYREALEDYGNALEVAPKSTTILHNRAALLLEMDSVRQAFDDYKRICAVSPDDAEARYFMGIIALEFGDMDLSKSCFDEILLRNVANMDAKRGLALWNKLNGHMETAIEMYSEIIKRENRYTNYVNRAECYLETGKMREAQDDIAEAQKLDPSSVDVYLLKARLAQLQYRFDDAANYAKQALALGCEEELAEPFLRKTKKE